MQPKMVLLAGLALTLAAVSSAAAPPSAKDEAARVEEGLRVAEFLTRGDVHWRGRRYQEALDSYLEAGKMRPDDPRVLYSIGAANRELGNYREALRNFTRVLEVAPDDPRNGRVYGQMGYIHWRANNYATAIEAYRAAHRLNPHDWRTLWYLADLHYKTKEYELTKDYVMKYKQLAVYQDAARVSEHERQEIRKYGSQLDDYLRRIEKGEAPR